MVRIVLERLMEQIMVSVHTYSRIIRNHALTNPLLQCDDPFMEDPLSFINASNEITLFQKGNRVHIHKNDLRAWLNDQILIDKTQCHLPALIDKIQCRAIRTKIIRYDQDSS